MPLPVYVEYTFEINPQLPVSEMLMAYLADYGFESFMEKDSGFSAYIQESQRDEKKVKELILSLDKGEKISWKVKKILPVNWNQEWEKNFQPIRVGDRCLVRAPFHETVKGIEYEVIIEPKMAFGTGHHQTTHLMIEKILVTNLQGKSSLDMGCGTGILAILASMKGANPLWAVDTDGQACENAAENIHRNKITNITVDKGGAEILAGKQFDVILANINRNVLLNDMQYYAESLNTSGSLVLSGFFREDVAALLKKASVHGLTGYDQQSRDNWALLELRKN